MQLLAWHFVQVLEIVCFVVSPASAQGPYKSLGDIFQHQLAGLKPVADMRKAPSLGGADQNHCCLVAVNESLEIDDGYLIFRPGQTSLHGNVSSFLRYQFPCGAKYNGSRGDQPQVWKSYSWCHEHCGGWQVSSTEILSVWVQPFIQYIVPAIVFVMNVPRRKKLHVPDRLFPRRFNAFEGISMLYKVPVASVILTLDIIIWLILVLAMAGPLIVSGVYEALLDLRLLNFIDDRMGSKSLSIQDKAQTLFTILLGNYDADPAWEDLVHLTSGLPTEVMRRPSESTITSFRRTHQPSKSGGATSEVSQMAKSKSLDGDEDRESSFDAFTQREIYSVKKKLSSMLECQKPFGSTVGAPIVFYTASFIYTILEIEANYGSSHTSHHLAFGTFWMIIPHIAIVSSLLLGSDNPMSFEGIISRPGARHTTEKPATEAERSSMGKQGSISSRMPGPIRDLKVPFYGPTYHSPYQPASMWDRGNRKAAWVAMLAQKNPHLDKVLQKEVLHVGLRGWCLYMILPALTLLLIPSFLGGMISFTTPMIGLSCRSLTMLLFVGAQMFLSLLWLWDWNFQEKRPRQTKRTWKITLYNVVWYMTFSFWIVIGIVTSIGGTVFVLIGLYGNCLCFITLRYWWHRNTDPGAVYYMGDGSTEQVYYAKQFWFPTGAAATVFLIAVTYLGWWYQRHLKAQFHEQVQTIDYVEYDHHDSGNNSGC